MHLSKHALSPTIFKVQITKSATETDPVANQIELDIENQANFVDFMNNIFDESGVNVILDMQNVMYIDSSGLWALFEGHKKAAIKGGEMVILNPSKDVKRVLDITKMSSKIRIFTQEEDALKAFKK
jgi:anti-sigma B factor antagonist